MSISLYTTNFSSLPYYPPDLRELGAAKMSNAMALNNDALLQFVGLANMRPFNAILIVIAVIGLFAAVTRKTRTSKLDHIPILGAELGDRGRKKEFRYNAKAFLGRGYEEASCLPVSLFFSKVDIGAQLSC